MDRSIKEATDLIYTSLYWIAVLIADSQGGLAA